MDLEKCRYVVVEGPIGAGKTSLARAARRSIWTARRCSSAPTTIRSSRASTRTWRATRCRRSSRSCSSASTSCAALGQLDMFRRTTVADFLLDKDPLFARLNLTDAEYALYEKVYSHLKPQAPMPDLVIYLQAPVDTLIERVHRRGVDYERTITARLPRAARRRVQPFLLRLRRRAAADRQQRAAELRRRPEPLRPAARADRLDARPARVLQSRRRPPDAMDRRLIRPRYRPRSRPAPT